MSKAGIDLSFRAYTRRDPVSGSTKTFLRDKHSRQSSRRLKEFQSCIASAMRGKTFRTGNARDNSVSVRSALASSAKQCAK